MSNRDWSEETVDHTFASGRTATIRPGLSATVLGTDAADEVLRHASDIDVDDEESLMRRVSAATFRRTIETLFVRPRVVWASEVPEHMRGTDEDGNPLAVTVYALGNDIDEALAIAQEGMAAAERFRNGSDGEPAGDDGDDLGDDAEQPAGAAEEESAGASG